MSGWLRALLFLLGGAIAAGGTAYFTGLLDPWLAPRPIEMTDAPQNGAPTPKTGADETAPDNTAPEQQAEDAADEDGEPATTAKQDRLVPPSFDLLRVEPDGSVVVAGKAGAGAQIELLMGETVLGSVSAGEEGDFVIVLDEQLAPGDYQLALRATAPGDEGVLSTEAAIISIPESADGEVLAMVDEPGAPAQLVTVPQVQPVAPVAPQEKPAAEDATIVAVEEDSEPDAAATVAETDEPAAPVSLPPQQQEAADSTVVVEAVEIEGETIFVAGRAAPGHVVRAYANTMPLGEAAVSEGGRFLVEAKRDLAIGNYMIRADLLDKDGNVVARAVVPFEREPGEAIAAVAPPPVTSAPAGPVAKTDEANQGEAAQPEAETAVAGSPPAASDEATTAAPLQRADGAVIIRRGDSLWRISRRVYGHGIRYSTIYLANQDQISDPDRIWPGQVFALPGETPEGDQADLEAIGAQSVEPQTNQPANE